MPTIIRVPTLIQKSRVPVFFVNTNLQSHLRIRLWFACTSDVVKAMSRQQLIFLCKTQPPVGHLRVHGPLDYWNHIPQWLKKLERGSEFKMFVEKVYYISILTPKL